jgi:cobalt-zinc-cadmium efflux system membrane fusion protein
MITRPLRRAQAVCALALFGLLAGCSKNEDQKSSDTASNVTLTAAQRQNIHLFTVARSGFHKSLDTTGIVDFDNDQATSVLAPISGPVTRLLVAPGDKVEKGQALAMVASPDFATAVGTYRKAVSTAQTLRKLADMDKDLLQHNGVSQREADQAETDATGAEADRDAALQGVVALGVDPRTIQDVAGGTPVSRVEGAIRSPLAGTVVERLITPGQLLQAGTTSAFTIADLSRVWVMAQVFDTDLGQVSVGDTATVTTGDRSMTGTVTNIVPEIDPNTRSMQVRVAVNNPGGFLKKQMYVHVDIQAKQQSDGILVPVSAILRDDENLPFVYVRQADDSFARRHVTLGVRTGDRYEISSGLAPRDQIVTDGGLFLQFMQNQ